ncbi:serine--tRNA ligase [Anoxybacter fermentans]|uniref:Serine--tRNA ligase n=1 Tax=Anoxybacter fermentans TaxID=1323375 RepID=A0A3S9T1Q0_9FIRM|nr:serine--tRNA ligase [Anoxybacter fermentans]AZR74533.1 serine--tRNA ligase [Anoxybacter fermentans]
MLDIKYVIENLEIVKENCKKRNVNLDLDYIVDLSNRRRDLLYNVELLRKEKNEVSRMIGGEKIEKDLIERAKRLKQEEQELSKQLEEVEKKLLEEMSWLPNILDPRVPVGGEEKNIVIKEVGQVPQFDFRVKSHEELGSSLGIIDIPRGVKLSKTRFYCLKNEGVMLRWALTKMFVDNVKKQGFELVSPPYLAKKKTLYISGYLPFAEKDNFKIEDEDLSLIGTSEQSLLGMHMDEILTKLPLLYLGESMCFRTEIGSYGKDNTGIFRVHQFYKLEQLVYCHPDESEFWHQQCLENEEYMLKELNIPYRVVLTASQDLAPAGSIKYDIEAWFPSQNKYREVTSNTNIRDYQTRRGNIRFKIDGTKGFPHTISATGFCDRLIIALMENYQQADGSIKIPEKLVPYMDGLTAILPKEV